MIMYFSVGTGYGLHALAALPEDGTLTQAKDLARQLGLPGPYLAKILKLLVKGGLLHSHRGPRGGFRLARPAQHITVVEVVSILNDEGPDTGCLMGFTNCQGRDQPCPLHSAWSVALNMLDHTFSAITIRDLQQRGLPEMDAVPLGRYHAPATFLACLPSRNPFE